MRRADTAANMGRSLYYADRPARARHRIPKPEVRHASTLARALALLCVALAAPAAADEARFMSFPDVRGDQIVFTWEGDLYRDRPRGRRRACASPATRRQDVAAKLSPDGRFIAYTRVRRQRRPTSG